MPEQCEFEAFFNDCDKDGNGSLTPEELIGLLKARGYAGSDGDLQQYFNMCDTSGDGKITMDEYLRAMGCIPQENHMEAAMRSVFRDFDLDGSGKIDAGELQKVFAEMGKHMSEQELERMIFIADKDQSGTLEYEEFIAHCFGK